MSLSPAGVARSIALRARVLSIAVDLASVDGLDGMTIGGLAQATGRAKSGITGLFQSKEGLQLAVLDEAERRFVEAIIQPAQHLEGAARLGRLLQGWVACSANGIYSGGCFLASSLHEMDGRPGPVRDAVSAFLSHLQSQIADAAAACLGPDGPTPQDIVFRATGIGVAANMLVQLGHRERALRDAERAIGLLLAEMGAPASSLSRSTTWPLPVAWSRSGNAAIPG